MGQKQRVEDDPSSYSLNLMQAIQVYELLDVAPETYFGSILYHQAAFSRYSTTYSSGKRPWEGGLN